MEILTTKELNNLKDIMEECIKRGGHNWEFVNTEEQTGNLHIARGYLQCWDCKAIIGNFTFKVFNFVDLTIGIINKLRRLIK